MLLWRAIGDFRNPQLFMVAHGDVLDDLLLSAGAISLERVNLSGEGAT
jgi:hypothetical protein